MFTVPVTFYFVKVPVRVFLNPLYRVPVNERSMFFYLSDSGTPLELFHGVMKYIFFNQVPVRVTVADRRCRGCGSGTETSGTLLRFRVNGWLIRSTTLIQRVS
jgi:hypothetical protein